MADATLSNDGVRARPRSPRRGPPPPLHCRTAIFLDIDGTLLDLALTPDLVRVDGAIAELLPALSRCFGGALALITGRTIADADRLFPGLALPVAGQHGVERRPADGAMIQNRRPSHELVRLRGNLGRFAARHEGVILEDKGATLALHYRQAPHLASLVHRTLRAEMAVAAHSRAWRLQSGKGIVEIRPDGRDKGTAIGEYMDEPPFLGRLPVFVGDDDTDEFGFAAVSRYDGWAVKVGPGPTGARYRLKDVTAVRRWLAAALVPAAPVA